MGASRVLEMSKRVFVTARGPFRFNQLVAMQLPVTYAEHQLADKSPLSFSERDMYMPRYRSKMGSVSCSVL